MYTLLNIFSLCYYCMRVFECLVYCTCLQRVDCFDVLFWRWEGRLVFLKIYWNWAIG